MRDRIGDSPITTGQLRVSPVSSSVTLLPSEVRDAHDAGKGGAQGGPGHRQPSTDREVATCRSIGPPPRQWPRRSGHSPTARRQAWVVTPPTSSSTHRASRIGSRPWHRVLDSSRGLIGAAGVIVGDGSDTWCRAGREVEAASIFSRARACEPNAPAEVAALGSSAPAAAAPFPLHYALTSQLADLLEAPERIDPPHPAAEA